mgnify:CR=1 FL=1
MSDLTNIFLVGPMGVGKSTIGRHLARRSRRRFVDSDKEIEQRTGVDIPTIFDIEGEAGFRLREARAIADLSALEGVVLATGGGAIESADNRALLSERGFVVYLTADPEELVARLRHDRRRPKLKEGDPAETIRRLFALRDPHYREIADLIVNTGNRTVRTVTEEVLRQCPK